MRIISQNGRIDTPYKSCTLEITNANYDAELHKTYDIIAYRGGTEHFDLLGTYESEKRCKNIMNELRACYLDEQSIFKMPTEQAKTEGK